LADPKGCRLPAKDQAAAAWAVSVMLGNAITRKTAKPIITYAERLDGEYQSVILNDALKRDKSISTVAEFGAWAVRHQEVVL
jgi:hypothetical protein